MNFPLWVKSVEKERLVTVRARGEEGIWSDFSVDTRFPLLRKYWN